MLKYAGIWGVTKCRWKNWKEAYPCKWMTNPLKFKTKLNGMQFSRQSALPLLDFHCLSKIEVSGLSQATKTEWTTKDPWPRLHCLRIIAKTMNVFQNKQNTQRQYVLCIPYSMDIFWNGSEIPPYFDLNKSLILVINNVIFDSECTQFTQIFQTSILTQMCAFVGFCVSLKIIQFIKCRKNDIFCCISWRHNEEYCVSGFLRINERTTQRITNKNYKFISLNKLSNSVTMCYTTKLKCTHTIEESK